jgi:hypothetical protein
LPERAAANSGARRGSPYWRDWTSESASTFPGVDDGDASAGGLSFLGGDIGEGVAAAVGFDPVSEELRLLDQVALNFGAQRSFPGTAEHQIEHGGGGHDDDQEGGHQLEENPVRSSLSGASKR